MLSFLHAPQGAHMKAPFQCRCSLSASSSLPSSKQGGTEGVSEPRQVHFSSRETHPQQRPKAEAPSASVMSLVGGDATLERFGSLDWSDTRFALESTQGSLGDRHPEIEHAEITSLMELLAYVAFASVEAGRWKGEQEFTCRCLY